jgi:hypothetical protein
VRDVAIVSFAQSGALVDAAESETQMLLPVINEAVERSGVARSDIGFTCSGSADYLAGTPFSFVANLEAVGAWPPISESHVDMDGAWAMYEAWVRLQHGDVDVALAFSSGISSRSNLREVLCLQNDPYYLMPLWADHVSLASLQAQALIDAGRATEADFAEVAARCRQAGAANPHAHPGVRSDARCANGRPGSAASTIAPTRTTSVCATSPSRVRRVWPASTPALATHRSRWPSSAPRSVTRSWCCAKRWVSAPTST